MNLPTKLTVARIVMIPLFIVLFFVEAIPYNRFFATAVFMLASATDFLDGRLARKYNLVTNLGKFLRSYRCNRIVVIIKKNIPYHLGR